MNVFCEVILSTWLLVLLALFVDRLINPPKSCIISKEDRKDKCKDCHKDE